MSLLDTFNSILGFDVVEIPPIKTPKFALSDKCPCSDKVREEFNAWLIQEFGYNYDFIIPPNEIIVMGRNIFCRPETLGIIRNLLI